MRPMRNTRAASSTVNRSGGEELVAFVGLITFAREVCRGAAAVIRQAPT
jgi:hypothetical protein